MVRSAQTNLGHAVIMLYILSAQDKLSMSGAIQSLPDTEKYMLTSELAKLNAWNILENLHLQLNSNQSLNITDMCANQTLYMLESLNRGWGMKSKWWCQVFRLTCLCQWHITYLAVWLWFWGPMAVCFLWIDSSQSTNCDFSPIVADSWGKPERGVLDGNLNWIGAYDECLNITAPWNETQPNWQKVKGQYCTLTTQLHLGVSNYPTAFRGE